MSRTFRSLSLALLCAVGLQQVQAQFAVTTNGGSGLAPTYGSLAAAITALNGATITSPVVITCPTGTETSPAGGYSITAQGTAVNTITIQGNGAANSIITAPNPAGTVGALNDAIFKLVGADFVTIQGFAMNENGANTTTAAASNNMVEWGVALLYASTTNGAQNNTIQNNSITLNRTYQNTFGIYANSTHSATAVTTSATATTTAGGNSGLKVYGNTITNVNQGIVVIGPTAAADMNTGIDIGGSSLAQGNTITNWGTTGTFSGYVNISGTLNCILIRNAVGFNVSYNTLTSSVGGNTVTASQRSIFIPAFSNTPSGTFTNTINNNTLSLQSGIASGSLNGIINETTTGTATSSLNISNNNFQTWGHTAASPSGACTFISNAMAHLNTTISGNTFTNISLGTTGSVTFISNNVAMPAGGSTVADNNSIVTAFNKTGAGGTVTLYFTNTTPSSPVGSTKSHQNNNFSNISLTGATTMAGWTDLEGATGGGATKTISNNTFSNWSCGTGAVNVLQTNFSGNGTAITGNTISTISTTATNGGNITAISIGSSNGGAAQSCSNNSISGLSGGSLSTVTGITGGSSSITTMTMTGNSVSGLSTTNTTATTVGIAITAGATVNLSGTTVHTLTGNTGAVNGIAISSGTNVTVSGSTIRGLSTSDNLIHGFNVTGGTTVTLSANKLYDFQSGGLNGSANGVTIAGGTTVNVQNNLIGDLRAPAASGTNQVIGINVSSATTSATRNVSFNTIYLNATSTGGNFGTSGVFHNGSSISTTNTLVLRNNIIVNTSTPNGGNNTAAFRRNLASLANYSSVSNNNLFYAGSPGTQRLIYTDGTNNDQTLPDFKGRVSTRDAASVTENPPFLSLLGSNANFLHIDPATPTQLESGGIPVAGITTDFDNNTRSATTPDIGADEFAGIAADLSGPTITYTALGNTCALGNRTLSATVTDNSGVPTFGAGLPVLYWRINAGAYTAATATHGGGSTYNFSFGAGVVSGDVVSYYIVAQDNATTPNVSVNPSAGAAGLSANPPAASTPPTTPSSYTISNTLSGTYTVGTGGNYATLNAAVAAYNTNCLGGPVVFELTDASYNVGSILTINANPDASATNTLTIRPATGVTTTISGANISSAGIIYLNGADWVTIDGYSGATPVTNSLCPRVQATRNMTIQQTASGASVGVVWLANGATNNIVRNCIAQGFSTSTTPVGIGSGGTNASIGSIGTDNDNNRYENNAVFNCQAGIVSNGASTANPNTGTVIILNELTTASGLGRFGIYSVFEDGIQVQGNTIGNLTAANDQGGIVLGISGTNLFDTPTSNAVINATVTDNVIGPLTSGGTNSAMGIVLGATTSGTTLIANNMIRGLTGNSTPGDLVAGIAVVGGAGAVNVYHNTVHLNGTQVTGTTPTSTFTCFAVLNSTAPTLDVKNNIFHNATVGATGSTSKYSAIALGYTSTTGNYAGLTSNYNDLFSAGPGPGTYCVGVTGGVNAGTVRSTLANWQTETGRDANSVNVAAVYVSGTDLHLDNSNASNIANLMSGGTPTSVTTDIDCATRSGTAPTIGADEFLVSGCIGAPTAGTSSGPAAVCSGLTASLSNTGASIGSGISFQWQVSTTSGSGYVDVTGGTGATTVNYTTGALAAGTYYYVLAVTCSNSSTTTLSNEVTVVVNPLPTVLVNGVAAATGSFCNPGGTPVALNASGASTYAWSPASGLSATTGASVTASPSASTTYTVSGTDGNGCVNTATAAITVASPPANVTAASAQSTICAGASTTLSATGTISTPANAYSLSATSGTFTPLSGGTTVGTIKADDAVSGAIPIGFSFNYAGGSYTNAYASSNGFLSFNSGVTSTATNNMATPAGSILPLVAPLWDDLDGTSTGTASYLTTGAAPNRVFTFEWLNWEWNYQANAAVISFQVKLHEADGRIEFVYRQEAAAYNAGTTGGASIGLVGTAAGNFLSLTNTSVAPGTSTVTETNNLTAKPATGQVYAFLPTQPTFSWAPAGLVTNPTSQVTATTALSATQIFTVTASNGACSTTANVTVTVDPLVCGALTTSGTACVGLQTVSANPSGGGTPYTYAWTEDGLPFGGNTQTITASVGTHLYVCTVTDACLNTCSSSLSVTTNPAPLVSIAPTPANAVICGTGNVVLNATGASTYAWSPATGLSAATGSPVTATPTSSTLYTVTGTDANGCIATASQVVVVTSQPVVSTTTATPASICAVGNSQLNVAATVTPYALVAPASTFVDISGTGTAVSGVVGDDTEANITIPAFTFNGTSYTAARIGANGAMVLGSTSGDVTNLNVAMPSTANSAGNLLLAPFWDDLDNGTTSNVYTATSGNLFIIQWHTWGHYGPTVTAGEEITFQVQLDLVTGAIHFAYADVVFGGGQAANNAGASATVGIQWAGTAGSALQYSNNTASLSNGQVITFVPNTLSYAWSPATFLNNTAIANPQAQNINATTAYTATVTSTLGCTAQGNVTVTVNPLPTVTCPANSSVCIDATAFALTGGSPAGGTYSGPGVTAGNFNPATAGAGTHTITYSYTDGNTCTNTCQFTITVNPLPVVTCPANITGICTVTPAFALSGGSPGGGTYSGTGVSAGQFDPAVSGDGLFTITYSYTDGNSCSASCTFTINVDAAPTWYLDSDGDGEGDVNASVEACTAPTGYVASPGDFCPLDPLKLYPGACGCGAADVDTDGDSYLDCVDACPTDPGKIAPGSCGCGNPEPGVACNDGNPNTINDVVNGSCQCVGTPVVQPCTQNSVILDLVTDGNGAQTTWFVEPIGGGAPLCTGTGYGNNATLSLPCCLPNGSYRLRVTDAGGDGIATPGGFVLRMADGRKLIDNAGNGVFTSTSMFTDGFKLPLGALQVEGSNCDRTDFLPNEVIRVTPSSAVSAQFGVTNSTSGYEWYFFNPNGGYTRKVFTSHANASTSFPSGAERCTYFRLNSLSTNPLPTNVLLNVKVRPVVANSYGTFGPVCRLKIDTQTSNCVVTQLVGTPGTQFSCGATGKQVNGPGTSRYIYAQPAVRVVNGQNQVATNYGFELSEPVSGYVRTAWTTSYTLTLAGWSTNPLLCGTHVYNVRVRASFDGGVTWCPYGPVCTVGITNNLAQPSCTPPANAFAGGNDRMDIEQVATGSALVLWPNPNRGDQLYLAVDQLNSELTTATLDLYDLFGKRVATYTLPVRDGLLNTAIDLHGDLATGMYLVTVIAGEQQFQQRLVID
ncbi:MAG: T9SS type A sorting domain-containing protein [Flavobacteriales bacterium]|nr:T9SS type A sorting domain-containing protein [Flavobacteriales bacterium]